MVIPLPRLYINGKFSRIIHPISVSITDNITPLSTATLVLPEGEELPVGSWAELFNPYGSAGMYRMRMPEDGYNETSRAQMEHMIAEVGDYNVKAEISEMMAATAAVQKLFSYYKGGKWKLGKISDLGSGRVAVDVKYDSVLSGILAILEQKPDCMMKYDFTTTPWTVSIVKRGTKVVSQGRITRNVRSAKVSTDESTMTTRVWYQTWSEDAEGNPVGTWTYKDADTMKTYNRVIERRLDTSSAMTAEEIRQMVDTYLKAHRHPRTSVSIQARELWRITGEKVDKFIVGDLFLLAIQKYSLSLEMNIISIVWTDVYNDPDNVLVHLGEEEESVVTFLHNLDATGEGGSGGGSGGGGGRAKQESKWTAFRSKWDVQENKIEGYVQRVGKNENILEQAGLKIDSKGVLLYADNGTKNTLYSRFKVLKDSITSEVTARKNLGEKVNKQTSRISQQADKISLVVEEKNGANVIKSASIITSINQDGSSIVLSADKIDLHGYVTVDKLNAVDGDISNLVSGRTTATNIVSTIISASAFLYNRGHVLNNSNLTIDGVTYNIVTWN